MKCSCPINIQLPTSDSAVFHFLYDWQGSVSGGVVAQIHKAQIVRALHSCTQLQFQPMAQHTVHTIITQIKQRVERHNSNFPEQLRSITGSTSAVQCCAISLWDFVLLEQNIKKTNLNTSNFWCFSMSSVCSCFIVQALLGYYFGNRGH